MMRIFYDFSMCLIFSLLFGAAVFAQPASNANQKKMRDEISDFRQRLIETIERRDRKILETLFADDFTHTHAVGKVDGKAKRIDAILSGDKTLESVAPDENEVRFHGKSTAVGQTTIENTVYRWTVVYIKNKKGWQIAASQASKKL